MQHFAFASSTRGDVDDVDVRRYQKFVSTHYSSTTILVLLLGYLILNECIFRDFKIFPLIAASVIPSLFWSRFCLVVRFGMAGSLCFIWSFKTEHDSDSTVERRIDNYLTLSQALFPVLMNLIFAGLIFSELISGSYIGSGELFQFSPVYFAQFGLQAYPLITFFLLRDTQPAAVILSWAIAVFTMLACSVCSQSIGAFISVMLYAVISATVFLEHCRQNKAMFAVVTKLEAALVENERLAAEAQASELRAMIGNVAHDLKTPLTSFLSGTEFMDDIVKSWEDDLKADRKEAFMREAPQKLQALRSCLVNMNSTNSFMTMTINRCLDYTKTSNGFKLVPKLETVELRAMLNKPVQLIHDTHSHNNIEIQVASIDPDICTHVITDRQWLIENLLCLLSNAVKYSNKGSVEVSVTFVSDTQGGTQKNSDDKSAISDSPSQFLRFQILDTGVGLSEEAMQSLFNPFKQAQRLAGGTGLGLFSLARRVEAIQGQYGVARRPDGQQGSMFWFTIPYRPDTVSASLVERADTEAVAQSSTPRRTVEDPIPTPQADEAPVARSLSPVPDWDHYRVMIVDDAPLVVKMVRMLLTGKGHKVEEKAVNGQEALEKLIHGYSVNEPKGEPPFDVVLMDLQMPVLDGIEAIRRLRAFEKSLQANPQQLMQQKNQAHVDHKLQPLTPLETSYTSITSKPFHQFVVALSANSDHETKQAAMKAGADAFLSKPFSYESFMAVMHST